jgi:hypothetical protein
MRRLEQSAFNHVVTREVVQLLQTPCQSTTPSGTDNQTTATTYLVIADRIKPRARCIGGQLVQHSVQRSSRGGMSTVVAPTVDDVAQLHNEPETCAARGGAAAHTTTAATAASVECQQSPMYVPNTATGSAAGLTWPSLRAPHSHGPPHRVQRVAVPTERRAVKVPRILCVGVLNVSDETQAKDWFTSWNCRACGTATVGREPPPPTPHAQTRIHAWTHPVATASCVA